MCTSRVKAKRAKITVLVCAANKYVYRVLAARLQGVNKSVSGNVSGQSNQRPYKALNFGGLVVCMGMQ